MRIFLHHLCQRGGLVLLLCALTACGYQLRGINQMSFKSIFIQGTRLSLSAPLEDALKFNQVKILSAAEEAEAHLELVGENSEKRILSLSGTGVVREYEIFYSVHFRMRPAKQTLWGGVQSVQMRRSFSYNDAVLIGKAEEEERLNADMRKDAVREMMRRLSASQAQ